MKGDNTVLFVQTACIISAVILLSIEYGWKTGIAIGLIFIALNPDAQ